MVKIEIFDNSGKMLINENTSPIRYIVNFNNFSSGIYLVKISTHSQTVVKKISIYK